MKEYTNSWGTTYKVGQVGTLKNKFILDKATKLTITGFTPTGQFMHAKNEGGTRYTFTTSGSCNLRGSHMGNSYISFK
jgi:hypothetical protein